MTSVLFKVWITTWDPALVKELNIPSSCGQLHSRSGPQHATQYLLGILASKHHLTNTTNGPGYHQEPQNPLQERASADDHCRYQTQPVSLSSMAMDVSSKVTLLDAISFIAKAGGR